MKCDNCKIEHEEETCLCGPCKDRFRKKYHKYVDSLPKEKMSQKAFDDLGEYSMSDPSSVSLGKVWKRNLAVFCGKPPIWVICEYVSSGPNMAKIDCRTPIIV